MGICRDRTTTYLQRFGYNVVRHPREGIAPLDVLGRQRGTTAYLGSLDKLVTNAGPLPKPKIGRAAADINGQTTSALHVGIGLSILKSVLSAFGGDVGVTSQYSTVETIRLEFTNVTADVVPPLDIAKFLNERVVASDPLVDRYVEGDGQLFVITETVKSDQITVIAEQKNGAQVKLDVPLIKNAIGGNVEVKAKSEAAGTVTYTGRKQLVFGFRCFEIGVDGGQFALFASQAGAATAMSSAGADDLSISGVVLAPDHLLTIVQAS